MDCLALSLGGREPGCLEDGGVFISIRSCSDITSVTAGERDSLSSEQDSAAKKKKTLLGHKLVSSLNGEKSNKDG